MIEQIVWIAKPPQIVLILCIVHLKRFVLLAENVIKITSPFFKALFRAFDKPRL